MNKENVTLYTTGCPKCVVLKKKLDAYSIEHNVVNDMEAIQEKGFMQVPMLDIDGVIMDFYTSVQWVNKRALR